MSWGGSILLLLLFLPGVIYADGTIYQWEDERGIVSFTDDIKKVPERYRNLIRSIAPSEKEATASSASRSSTRHQLKTDTERKNKRWWGNLAKRWDRKRRDAEGRINEIQLEMRQVQSHQMLSEKERAKEELRMKRLLKAATARRDVANRMLAEGLPNEARKAGVPLEWLRIEPQ